MSDKILLHRKAWNISSFSIANGARILIFSSPFKGVYA